ncbi:hypothetical protein CDAR_25261 [Caerostris darwini]|uniref:Uncharacterized protein n=1 Tax=Caerostris darwini TaxID=1538125 RepID=A0AAV4PF07_9ARAC|nr:hypothetical protein CDAR_25261 [Caerostris darwini]
MAHSKVLIPPWESSLGSQVLMESHANKYYDILKIAQDTIPSPTPPVPVFATTSGRDPDEWCGHSFRQVLSNCIDRLLMESDGPAFPR